MSDDRSGRDHIDPELLSMIDESDKSDWIFVKNLKKDDLLEIQTMNTLYTMKVTDPEKRRVLVHSTGRHITEEVNGTVVGTTLTGTGTMVKMGGITPFLELVLWVEGKGELILSPTQEVRVNGKRVLPTETITR